MIPKLTRAEQPIQIGTEVLLSLFETRHKVVALSPDRKLARIEPSVSTDIDVTFVQTSLLRPAWMVISNN